MTSLTHLGTTVAPVVPPTGRLTPLGVDAVTIRDGFWGDRRAANHTATLPHILHWLEREGWLANFDLAAEGRLIGHRRGREFADSEVYKYLEAVAWELAGTPDAELEDAFHQVVSRIAAAQESDGYLNTVFGRPGQQPRWSDLEWGHELYCFGHLFQAAVARSRTCQDADDPLVEIARRAADLVCDTFGPDGLDGICGHPEIETALAELGRALSEPRYTAQAALFVDRRGHHRLKDIEWGRSYYQDDVPVKRTTVLHGHAVRANYLAAGAVDAAVDAGDSELLASLADQWDATVSRRTYITGGQGAHHQDEAFGLDFELPSDRAYSETCAGVGSIMFSWRLLLATGDNKYADLIERTLFNVIATSPAADGRSFFYSNTLHQREEGIPASEEGSSPRASSSLRAPWFEVSCCPPNVARTLASLPAYIATATDDGVQIHQFTASDIRADLANGALVDISVETAYPAQGTIRVTVNEDSRDAFALGIRIPAWAQSSTCLYLPNHGSPEVVPSSGDSVEIVRAFRKGDIVDLTIPVEPRVSHPDPRIDAIRDCIAVERGPEVMCIESVDLPEGLSHRHVDEVFVDWAKPLIKGREDIQIGMRPRTAPGTHWPYARNTDLGGQDRIVVPLVPYHSWGNRGPATMRVWLPLR